MVAIKLFLSLTRINFAEGVSSRAVRISSRAVRVFPALSRVRPSYRTFSLMVFQENYTRGRTGHVIIKFYFVMSQVKCCSSKYQNERSKKKKKKQGSSLNQFVLSGPITPHKVIGFHLNVKRAN